jgi:RHS repeat-associated protein
MADMGRRKPSADESLHTLPLDASLLAPPFERVMPEVTDRESEVSQCVPVSRHSEVPDMPATGKRQTMTDASGTTTYTYDNMDRLLSKATPEGTLSYTYDGAGHLASMQSSNSNGVNVSYTYDTLNRLHTVIDSHLGTTTYSYDDANNVANVTYPNGVQTAFTYDELNRVKATATQTLGYSYMRNPAGHITNALELDNRSITWNYDGINRLQSEQISNDPSGKNGQVSYSLDPVGNRSSATSSIAGLTPVGGTVNPDGELTSAETYDQNGNVTSTGGKSFAYNSQNQLISMGNTMALVYDGDGNRVAKAANGVTTKYLVDDLNPTGYPQVVDELTNGVVTRTYAYGLQRVSQDQVVSNSWTPSFYVYDGGGSVRALTNPAGTTTDAYEYDAFGNLLNKTGSTPNNMLYRGEEFDSDLGLYYLRARYLNPLTGRFMSRDPEDGKPTDPKSLHKYLYADGDPVNGLDPTGRADAVEGAYADTIEIAFGHGARHLIGTALSQAEVEAAIEAAVRELLAEGNVYGNFWGVINDFGIPIWYRAYFASAVLLNIGTYTIGH